MSRDTSQQPFAEDQPRSTDDKKLVSQVLGEQAAAEMAELTGEADNNIPAKATELALTGAESSATRLAEEAITHKKRKQEYYDWAESIGGGKGWVDTSFKFNEDGTVECLHGIKFTKLVERIPPSLKVIHGCLDTADVSWATSLSVLKNVKIMNELKIRKDDARGLPPGIDCEKIILRDTASTNFTVLSVYDDLTNKGYKNIETDY